MSTDDETMIMINQEKAPTAAAAQFPGPSESTSPSPIKSRSGMRQSLWAVRSCADPSLSISAFTISTEGTLLESELDEVLPPKKESGDNLASMVVNMAEANDEEAPRPPFVLDAEITSEADLAVLRTKVLERFALPTLMRRHLTLKQLQTPQVLSLNRAVLVVIRALPPSVDDLTSTMGNLHHSAVLCVEGGLLILNVKLASNKTASGSVVGIGDNNSDHSITLKQKRERHLTKDAVSLMMKRENLPHPSTSGVLAIWLTFHLSQVTRATHKLRSRVFELAEVEDEDISRVDLVDIVRAKDCFLRLSAVSEEQDEVTQSLMSGESVTQALDFDKMKGYSSVLLSSASSNERMVSRLEKRVDDLRQAYDANQQARINRRLAVLTIVSAIFLPLSLISGIFGMNFVNMPPTQRENAYFFCLGGMALLATILLAGFYRFGWLL